VSRSDWTEHSVYDLASYQNGRAFKSGDTRGASGLPIIKIAELNRGITAATGKFDGTVEACHLLVESDIVFSWSGTIVVTRWRGADAALNQHLFKVSVKPDFDEDFVYYLLQSLIPRFNGIVDDQRTTMGHVKVTDLRAMRVLLPPKPQQVAVGKALRTLDEKLRLNGEIVAKTERLLVARLREIEVGSEDAWDGAPLTAVADFVNGGAFTKGASGAGRMVIRIRELNSGPNETTVYSDIEVPATREANAGDILFAWSGSLGVYRWSGPTSIINQHIFKVVPKVPAWLAYVRLIEHLPEFRAVARDKATTMGHIQRHHLEEAMARVPSEADLATIDTGLGPLWSLILAAEKESRGIATLHKSVLPQLVSGRIPAVGELGQDSA
jgi:type I restriction enzyme S subunit